MLIWVVLKFRVTEKCQIKLLAFSHEFKIGQANLKLDLGMINITISVTVKKFQILSTELYFPAVRL